MTRYGQQASLLRSLKIERQVLNTVNRVSPDHVKASMWGGSAFGGDLANLRGFRSGPCMAMAPKVSPSPAMMIDCMETQNFRQQIPVLQPGRARYDRGEGAALTPSPKPNVKGVKDRPKMVPTRPEEASFAAANVPSLPKSHPTPDRVAGGGDTGQLDARYAEQLEQLAEQKQRQRQPDRAPPGQSSPSPSGSAPGTRNEGKSEGAEGDDAPDPAKYLDAYLSGTKPPKV
jgi:hypothetical protein